MLDSIAHLFGPLLRFLWPAQGRHRWPAPHDVPTEPCPGRRREPVPLARPPRNPHESILCGAANALVRPYLLAHERDEARRQRVRRRALWLAVHGIDVGPRRIHGIEVPA
ncbi:hypothetical protein [Streptomyces kanamyceticus]|uniref:hypothetical protein n=1 Tax=Streptomyces kanamyceticus TaxID=1967 RepID=UPI0037DC210B